MVCNASEISADRDLRERYCRNLGTIGVEGQARLLASKVAIVGAGGLGGTVFELLLRMGVGYLRIIDGDVFLSHNLNRQLLSTEKNLGTPKVGAAVQRGASINSKVVVEAVEQMLTQGNAATLLSGVDVIVDALDSIATRRLLGTAASQLKTPLVHAAIAGFTGQVMTVMPGDAGLERLYPEGKNMDKGIEIALGNPAATPAIAAALQTQEVVKLLTGCGEPIRNRLLYFDTQYNLFEFVNLK